jgi:hypothetical protein
MRAIAQTNLEGENCHVEVGACCRRNADEFVIGRLRNVGGSSSRFYNTHSYVINPNGGPAKVMHKQRGGGPINPMGVRFNPANRMLYR